MWTLAASLLTLVLTAPALAAPSGPADEDVRLSVVHGIPGEDDFELDVQVADTCVAEEFEFGEIEGPLLLDPGTYTVVLRTPSDPPCEGDPVLGPADFVFEAGQDATLVAHLDEPGEMMVLSRFTNDLAAVTPGSTRVVVHHLAALPPVDVVIGRPGASPPAVTERIEDLANPDRAAAELRPGRRVFQVNDAATGAALLGPFSKVLEPFSSVLVYAVGEPLPALARSSHEDDDDDDDGDERKDDLDDDRDDFDEFDDDQSGVRLLVDLRGVAKPGTVFDPKDGTWFRRGADGKTRSFRYGFQGTMPVQGDWDDDGLEGIGVYHPDSGTWYLRDALTRGPAQRVFRYGFPGTRAVVGDWDDDGKSTIGVYHPSTGTWLLRDENSAGRADHVFRYGFPGTIPVVGDWDGDGHATIGVYHSRTGTWLLRDENSAGGADHVFRYGFPGTIPVVGDWDGDGRATIGVYHPGSRRWFLRNDVSPGPPDAIVEYGLPGTLPSAP